MQVIPVLNQKGGVGKTTTSVNLARALALFHKLRVLLLDFDPQGNCSYHVGVQDDSRNSPLVRFFVDKEPLKQVVKSVFGFDVLPGGKGAKLVASELEGDIFALAQNLPEDWDAVIIDCPPNLEFMSLMALNAANSLLVPMPLEVFPLKGFDKLLSQIETTKRANPALKLGGVFASMVDKRDARANLNKAIRKEIEDNCADTLLKTTIFRNIRLAEAPNQGRPIFDYDPNCPGAGYYKEMAAELRERGIV